MEKLIDVIKYEGDNQTLIYKYPSTDFNLGTQLIVHESQEAVLFKDGIALESFNAGLHTLDTDNIAVLKNAINSLAGKNIFHSEVYFINLTTELGVKWGTDSKIRMFDPISGLHLEIGACGTFNIKVADGRKLLIKVVGTASAFEQEEIFGSVGYSTSKALGLFRGMIVSKVKTNLARAIRENDINILEVDEHIDLLSELLRGEINKILDDYGMYLPEFFITTIQTPDEDPNFIKLREQHAARYLKVQEQRIKKAEAEAKQEVVIVEAETEAKKKRIEAEGQANAEVILGRGHGEALRAQGADYNMETARIVGSKAAENESGGGSIVGELVKAGVGIGVGTQVAKKVVETVDMENWECPHCHHKGNKGNFCEQCGKSRVLDVPTTWECKKCGAKGLTGNFCSNCGAAKEE